MDIKTIKKPQPKIDLKIIPKIGPKKEQAISQDIKRAIRPNGFQDVKIRNKLNFKSEIVSNPKNQFEPEIETDFPNKILIFIPPAIILIFIIIMAKIFIIDPLSSKEELFPEFDKNSKSTLSLNKKIADDKTGSPSQSKFKNDIPSKPNSVPPPKTPDQSSEEKTDTETAENSETENEKETAPETAEANPSQNDKFISGSPIKISEINKISKFRSCAKEAYGKTSFQNQNEPESSLLHYFNLKNSKVSVSAPFDGEIIHKGSDLLVIETRPFNGWLIEISGFNPKNNLTQSSQVKIGDEIGKSNGEDMKIAVLGFQKSQKKEKYKNYSGQNLDSFFSHLNDSLNKEFSDKGASASSMIVSKSDRDNKECVFKPDNEDDWATLK